MNSTFIKALDRVHADEALRQKTADYIRTFDANVISIERAKRKPVYVKRIAAVACAALLLCALPIGTYAVYKTPTSYVSVDINPSVELGINTFGKVVSVTPYNTDGETVLSGLSLLNQDVGSAVSQIVESASQNGFIKNDGSSFISITAETNSGNTAEQLENDAEAGAQDAIASENDTATVETEHIGLDRRDDAISLGISPGKLNLIEKLQALDPTITVDAYKDATVTDIQKKFVELKKAHNGQNKDGDESASTNTSALPSASPDASTSASPSASPVSPDSSEKPNGHVGGSNNGNGNKKGDDTAVNPNEENNDADGSPVSSVPAHGNSDAEHGNSGTNGNSGTHGKALIDSSVK